MAKIFLLLEVVVLYKYLVLTPFLLLMSCSTIGGFLRSKMENYGMITTVSNQNYQKLKQEGYVFAMGYLTVLYNGIDITEACAFGLNSSGGPGIDLDETGAFIIPTKEVKNTIHSVGCAKTKSSPYFQYSFAEVPLIITDTSAYVGEVTIDFTSERTDDPNKKFKNVSPWIKRISHKINSDLKHKLEHLHDFPSSPVTKIEFR